MSDSVGSVSVDVVPDARGWSEKLRAQLRDQTVTINADADTTEAETQLDAASRTRTAKIKADVSQFSQGASKLDQFVGNLRLLPALAIVAGSALIPLAGVLGGIVAALAAPLVIAGGGATLFAFLAGFAVKDTEKQLKAISTAQAKLDGLTKGTKEYAAAQKELTSLQKGLSPQQRQFSNAQSNLSASFQSFIGGKAGVALLGPLTQGMKLLSQILPSLTPILVAAGGAFSTLLGDLGDAVSSPGFDHFIKLVSGQVGHDILGFGHVLGSLASGLGGLFVQLDKKAGSSMVDQLVRLSGAFSDWANSDRGRKAVQSFLNYAHDNGPQVAHTLGAIARAFGHIVDALAPLGPPTLRVIQGISDALSAIPVPVLTGLAGAFVGLVALQKVGGLKAIGALGNIASSKSAGGGVVSSVLGGGVQKVFVVNMAEGGLGGGGVFGKGSGALTLRTLAITATQVALVGAITYYGAKGVQQGVRNVANAATDTSQNRASPTVGGSGPRTATTVPAPIYPGTAGYRQYVGRMYATTTALDSIKAAAGRASRAEDMIGPHAAGAAAVANRAIDSVQAHLNNLRDRKFTIVAQTASAIASLERLQALTIRDKSFNVIQNNIERTVGPGGGMQHHALGGWARGAGTGTSDSIVSRLSDGEFVVNARSAAQNRALLEQINSGQRASYAPSARGAGASGGMGSGPLYLVLDDGTPLRAYVQGHADAVYHANNAHAQAVYG